MAAKKFEYRGGERTAESVTRRRGKGGYDSYLESEIPIVKVTEGEHLYRILPPTWDAESDWGDGWEIKVFLHYSVGPDKAHYLCLDKMKGEPCPICEARAKAEDEAERKAFRAAEAALAWVIDRDSEKSGPQVWRIPITLFNDIIGRAVDKKTNRPILLDDPEKGYDITFNREGTKQDGTKYTQVDVSRDSTPIHDDQKKENAWLDYVQDNPLPEVLKYYDYEYLEKALMGTAPREANGERGEREEPAPRGRSSREERDPEPRGRRGREEPPEEDPPPRSRRGGREEPEEPEPGRQGGRGEAVDDARDAAPSGRRGARGGREDPPEDPEGDRAVDTRSGRRGGRGDPPEDPEPRGRRGRGEPEADETPTGRARGAVERLRSRRG